jgi:hypothetical protein
MQGLYSAFSLARRTHSGIITFFWTDSLDQAGHTRPTPGFSYREKVVDSRKKAVETLAHSLLIIQVIRMTFANLIGSVHISCACSFEDVHTMLLFPTDSISCIFFHLCGSQRSAATSRCFVLISIKAKSALSVDRQGVLMKTGEVLR